MRNGIRRRWKSCWRRWLIDRSISVTWHGRRTADLDRIGHGNGEVRLVVCCPKDHQALWDNLDVIEVFAPDHAPHTKREKESDNPSPGLEMILPLLLTTFNEDRLSLEDLIAMFYKNPKWNFGLPEQPNTYDEDDFNEEWIIPEVPPHYKTRWSS